MQQPALPPARGQRKSNLSQVEPTTPVEEQDVLDNLYDDYIDTPVAFPQEQSPQYTTAQVAVQSNQSLNAQSVHSAKDDDLPAAVPRAKQSLGASLTKRFTMFSTTAQSDESQQAVKSSGNLSERLRVKTGDSMSLQTPSQLSGSPISGGFGSIRKKKTTSMMSTLTAKGRNIMSVFGQFDEAQMETSSLTPSADDDDDDDLKSSISLVSSQPILRSLQVYIQQKASFVPAKQFNSSLIVDLVRVIVDEQQLPDSEPSNYRLYKMDRNMLVARVLLPMDSSLDTCKLNDGDELRLKHQDDVDSLIITIPPSKEHQFATFGQDDMVRSLVDRLLEQHAIKPSPEQKYGLYYRKLGLWLDDKKLVSSYEFEQDHVVELRLITQEFLLRIMIPDMDTKFTIKVLPNLEVEDVYSMVSYNLRSRRVSLLDPSPAQNFFAPMDNFVSTLQSKQYGLYISSKNVWLVGDKQLKDYQLNTSPEEVHYKVRYRRLVVKTPAYFSKRYTELYVNEQQTCKDVLKIINMESVCASEWSTLLQVDVMQLFGLFTRGNERMKDDDLIWDVLKDLSVVECLEYRMVSRKIQVASSQDQGDKLEVELDLSKTVEEVLPSIWRRFGITGSQQFVGLGLQGQQNDLLLYKTLIEQNVRPIGSTLVIHVVDQSQPLPAPIGVQPDLINIWEVPETPDQVTYSNNGDKAITAATLNKLIIELTAVESSDPNLYQEFLKTFLLTYQSFTTPSIFLRKLIERYHVPRMKSTIANYADYDKIRSKILLRVCNVIQQWTKKYYYDFVDQSQSAQESSKAKHALLLQVQEFAESVIAEDQPALGRQIRKNVLRLRDGSWVKQLAVSKNSDPFPPAKFSLPPNKVINGRFNPFSCDPEEIARQLTLIEFDLFANIMPYEFLNQAWTKADCDQRAPNIIAVTKRFNDIAYWVAKSIVEVKTIKARVKRMTKLVDIAGHLYALNNFSTLMAFIAGFSKAAVTRLKYTTREMSARAQKKLQDLEAIMSAESSYKVYRAKIHTVNPPCIPYLGVYLLDLTYMEDGNPNKIGSLINFAKRRLIYVLIREMQQYQDKTFNLKPVPEMVDVLKDCITFKQAADITAQAQMKQQEDQLFAESMEREPRGAERAQIL